MTSIIRVVIVLAACCLATAAHAVPTFSDNFDSYTTGTLVPQGGWQGWDNASGAAGSLVSDAYAASSPNSVMVSGADDLVHTFSGVTSGVWEFSLKQFIPNDSEGSTSLILMSAYQDNAPDGYNTWAVQDSFAFTATTGTVSSQINGGQGSATIIKNQWIDVRYLIDLDALKVTAFYNGAEFDTHDWGSVAAFAAVDLYADGSGPPVYYDNVVLQPFAVPEPSCLSLLAAGAGLPGLMRCRARRRSPPLNC